MVCVYLKKIEEEPGKKPHALQHEAGLMLLGNGLLELYGLNLGNDAAAIEEQICQPRHGKPYIKGHEGIHYNISHSRKLAGCAFSDCPVGLDLEYIRPVSEALIKRVMIAGEEDLLKKAEGGKTGLYETAIRFWTLKESMAKCLGRGISDDFKIRSFSRYMQSLKEQEVFKYENLWFYQQKPVEGCIMSVCSVGKFEEGSLVIKFAGEVTWGN